MAWPVNQEFDKNKAEKHWERVLGIIYMMQMGTDMHICIPHVNAAVKTSTSKEALPTWCSLLWCSLRHSTAWIVTYCHQDHDDKDGAMQGSNSVGFSSQSLFWVLLLPNFPTGKIKPSLHMGERLMNQLLISLGLFYFGANSDTTLLEST